MLPLPAAASRPSRLPLVLLAAMLALAASAAGCGNSDERSGAAEAPGLPAPSLTARIAVAGPLGSIDPLYASSRAERLIARQIFEPLADRLERPFDEVGSRRGPARPLGRSAGGRIWTFELRSGVSFHDGSRLSVEAVTINAQRWLESGVAEELIPELVSVDSPIPGQVRFQLSEPVDDLPERLADGRFGLVSPAVIRTTGTDPIRGSYIGTGPFEVRELTGEGALLAGSAGWWGTPRGLGPGVERLELSAVDDDSARLELLASGSVEVADELRGRDAEMLAADPLTSVIRGAGTTIGLDRSVRGLDEVAPDQPLSQLWLTTLR